jgi:hypothetical protein
MKKSQLLLLSAVASIAIFVTSCTNLPTKEALLDIAANLAIQKYQNASCQEVAQMQSQSPKSSQANAGKEADLQAKAIEMLQKNPEMRQAFINRVAGPIANKMFECNLIP